MAEQRKENITWGGKAKQISDQTKVLTTSKDILLNLETVAFPNDNNEPRSPVAQ